MSICSVFRTRPMKEKTRGEPNRIHAVGLRGAAAQWHSRGTSLARAPLRKRLRGVPDQLRSPKWSCSARAARLPARRGGFPHPPRRTATRWQPVTVWLIEVGQHRATSCCRSRRARATDPQGSAGLAARTVQLGCSGRRATAAPVRAEPSGSGDRPARHQPPPTSRPGTKTDVERAQLLCSER